MSTGDLHDPLLSLPPITGQPANRSVVLHPQKNVPAFQVEQSSDLSRDPLRAQIIPLEFDT